MQQWFLQLKLSTARSLINSCEVSPLLTNEKKEKSDRGEAECICLAQGLANVLSKERAAAIS